LTQQGRVHDSENRDALVVFDPSAPASAVLRWELRDVQPCIRLLASGTIWTPQRDLLASDRFATQFVVEVEQDGTTHLRFGDNVLGQRPAGQTCLKADYRVGNGVAGNVGANAIARVVCNNPDLKRVWNPLPAKGGVEPETMEQARQFAPQAFRQQQRAVTSADYVEITQRRADVQRAAARYRWTGSWYTAFVTVDRAGGLPVDEDFERDLRDYLNSFRLAGYDLEINGPISAALELAILVCVKPGFFRSDVRHSLLRVFSSRTLSDGRRGFFHPDNFTFGQSLYLSRIYEAAQAVDGVASVEVQKFQRWGKTAQGELANGVLTAGSYEVIRLDNDPNFPENGKIDFVMGGGL
jgi:predicted phage baseplate assembly protein